MRFRARAPSSLERTCSRSAGPWWKTDSSSAFDRQTMSHRWCLSSKVSWASGETNAQASTRWLCLGRYRRLGLGRRWRLQVYL
jgi:hypothetical protein